MRIRGYAPATPCWAELATSDPAAATIFYSGLFGWQVTQDAAGRTIFTLGDLVVAGVAPVSDGRPPVWLTYISTEDLAATAEQVTLAGGAVLQPPSRVGEQGQQALFTDCEGAVFGAWQAGRFRGAQLANEANAVLWSDVATWDVAGVATFYGKVFGWAEKPGSIPTGFDYREWSVSNRVVAGLTPMSDMFPPDTPAHWRTTVEVDDCDAAASRCTELGGQVVVGPLDVKVGQYAQLIDPQGAPLGVIELVPELRLTP